jgi:hypothetical protein
LGTAGFVLSPIHQGYSLLNQLISVTALAFMVAGRVSFEKYNSDVAYKFGDLWVESTMNEKQDFVTSSTFLSSCVM